MSSAPCIACGGPMTPWLDGAYDERYGYPGQFRILRCEACGQGRTAPGLTEDDLASVYSRYYPRSDVEPQDVEHYVGVPGSLRARLRRWWEGTGNQGQYDTRPGDHVLDYGCGSCQSLLEIRALGGEPYGVEADPNVRRIAEHFGLRVHIGSLRADTFADCSFDIIVMNQVLEHVPDPAALLDMCARRLTPGGRLILAFPNANSVYRRLSGIRWINWHVPYHIHHFTRGSFRVLCQRLGFNMGRMRTVTPNLWTELQLQVLGEERVIGHVSPMWGAPRGDARTVAPPLTLAARVAGRARRIVAGLWWRARRIGIAAGNRVVDACGAGDSFLVELRLPERSQ